MNYELELVYVHTQKGGGSQKCGVLIEYASTQTSTNLPYPSSINEQEIRILLLSWKRCTIC